MVHDEFSDEIGLFDIAQSQLIDIQSNKDALTSLLLSDWELHISTNTTHMIVYMKIYIYCIFHILAKVMVLIMFYMIAGCFYYIYITSRILTTNSEYQFMYEFCKLLSYIWNKQ